MDLQRPQKPLLLFIQFLLYYIKFILSILYGKIKPKAGDDMKEKYYDKYRKIGLKISYYRKLRGMTQEQLAEKINKNLAFIGAVEAPNVNRTVSLDTLFDISAALNIPPYKFFVDDE